MINPDQLQQALQKGFVDKEAVGSALDPKFIVNQPSKQIYLLDTIQDEVESCKTFFFSVAFLTQDGLNSIKTQLADLAEKGIEGRLLTSTYLGFNQPDVFVDLLKIPNLNVRISKKVGFHSKGYLFDHGDFQSFIIGSSNMTMSALKINYEWNVYLTSREQGEVISQIQAHLEDEWNASEPLSPAWIENYRKTYQKLKIVNDQDLVAEDNPGLFTGIIAPNEMQKAALANLREMRELGYQKALVISATGTGKTYLAAFDAQQVKPKQMLFIVHREQILRKAMESFHRVIGGKESNFGILSGNQKDLDAKYLFATIQSISKDNYLQKFGKNYFDYIVIDEVHKAGAASYQKVIDFFEPQFLLGMTATPERTDGKNIFEMFDYHVAYEIRLQEALNENFLCPFNYFGVTEYIADGQVEQNTQNLANFVSEERVKYIIDKLDYYGCSDNNPKGLVFCGNRAEAIELAKLFNKRGIAASSLTGMDSIEKREEEVAKLERGEIKYIFTVDIFNEGIDIPKINQIVMLRYTESSIIFIQQLGRGLRKDPSKKYVTVLDFIGDYQNNYMIPMALAGDDMRNKNNLRKNTFSTNYITGLSSVSFERVAKERIFKSINSAKLDSMTELKKVYETLKMRLNRVPYLADFQKVDAIDPQILTFKTGQFDSYYRFLQKLKENEDAITDDANNLLSFVGRELILGQREHELVLLNMLTANPNGVLHTEFKKELTELNLPAGEDWVAATIATLDISYYAGGIARTYQNSALVESNDEKIFASNNLQDALKTDYFPKLWNDLLTVGFENCLNYDQTKYLTLNKKYKRRDTLRLLQWPKQMVDQNIGGYTYNNDLKKFVIFMTVDKGPNFMGAQMAYEDEILDDQRVLYFTKAPRRLTSPEVQVLQNAADWNIYLFAKKSDDEGSDFYYLGEVTPLVNTIQQLEKPINDGTKRSVVSLELKLHDRIKQDLYKYLTTPIELD